MANDKNLKVKAQFFKLLMDISNFFPDYTMSQHMAHILRSKGDDKKPYHWTDEELLKKTEKYYDELNSETSDENDSQ